MDFLLSLALMTNVVATSVPMQENEMLFPKDFVGHDKEVPQRLSQAEIQQRMQTIPDWQTDGESLLYERTFGDFLAAIAFVNQIVEPAEALGHHPDITIRYNQVTLYLTTHDAGGLTELDFELAAAISQLN